MGPMNYSRNMSLCSGTVSISFCQSTLASTGHPGLLYAKNKVDMYHVDDPNDPPHTAHIADATGFCAGKSCAKQLLCAFGHVKKQLEDVNKAKAAAIHRYFLFYTYSER